MRRRSFPFVVFVVVMSARGQTGWKMVWSDEFSGPANSQPDSRKWAYDLGSGGWGDAELETYTNVPENVHLDGNGHVIIRALRTAAGVYTSGRLKTKGKFDIIYGKIEARIKLPFGQGIWPAFWMIGSNIGTVAWPACGENDIMENIGREPSINHGSMHGPGYSSSNSITAAYTLSGGRRFADDFHLFTIIWIPESVEFFVDSISYQKVTPASLPPGRQWVFNKPFFLLLNVAVGGTFPGYPDATTQFPQEMTVDYVHAYQAVPAPATNPGGVAGTASFTNQFASRPMTIVSTLGRNHI